MDDPALVCGGEARAICAAYSSALRAGNGTAHQHIAQRLAIEELGQMYGDTVVFADVVDDEDVRMIERAGGARFLVEAAAGGRRRWRMSTAAP